MHPDTQKEIKRLERILMQRPKDLSTLRALVSVYIKEEMSAHAKKILFKIIEIDSSDTAAHNSLGILSAIEKNYTEAKQHFLKAIAININDPSSHYNLASVFVEEKNYTKAKQHFLKAIEINPNSGSVHYNIGNIFAEEKNYAKAKQHYLKAIDINPNNSLAHYNLATIFAEQKNFTKAKQYYLKAIEINPNNASAHNNLGLLFIGKENYTKAKQHFLKAVEILPNNADSNYNLANVLSEEKNYAEAKQYYLKTIEINPNNAIAHTNLGALFAEEKNYAEAKKHFLKGIEINPDNSIAHANLGILFVEEKNYVEAKIHYLKTLEINPNDTNAHNNIGILFFIEKNYTEAKQCYLKTLEINPNDENANTNLGFLFIEEKNFTKAKQYFQKAADINPNDSSAHFNLGSAFIGKRNYTKAKQHFQKAIDLNPNDDNAHYNLGGIFIEEKNYAKAEQYYLKAVAINPRNEHFNLNLAFLYKEMGDVAQFTKYYLIATEIDANIKIDEWEEEVERPLVLLSIAHFGAIKNIKIQLKRLTVFIGQQGQGKSTVAKLICIIESLKTHLVGQDNATPELLHTLFVKEISNYGLLDYLQPNSFFRWENGVSHIEYKDGAFSFSNIMYANSEFLYVPAERNFVAVAAGAMQNLLLNEVPIMRSLLKFGAEFEKARARFTDQNISFLGVKYRYNNGTDYIESGTEGNKSAIKMSESASSHQAVVPMYVCMKYWSEKYNKSMLVIEEPELNLFPTSQKVLIGFIIESCLFAKPNNQLIITTHSPYTLTSLNNLMQADNTHRLKPRLIDEILAIVPFERWVDANHIAAYHLKEGDAINIFDKEYRIIADSGIDEVSDTLNEEFNQLLDLLNQ